MVGGIASGGGDLVRSKVPRLIWMTGIVGSSRLKVSASDDNAELVIVFGALNGGCSDGMIDGVRNMIFDDG